MSRLNLGHTARSVFCLLSTLVSCREATPPQPVPGNVGPAGGTVELAGGAVVVRVPAGALSAPVLLEARPVTLSPKEGTLFVAGSGFTVGPSSVRFNAPVSLTLRIPQVGIPQGVLPGELRIVSVSNSVWNQLAPDSRSQEQGTLSASIISSGDFGVIGVPVASVTMSPSSAQVSSRHEVVFLRAEARDADGNLLPGRPISWSTSDSANAAVSSDGIVDVGAATAVITASSQGRSAGTTVRLKDGAANPVSFEDFSAYSSTANFLANPRGFYVPSEELHREFMALDKTVAFGTSAQSYRMDFTDRTADPDRCNDRGVTRLLTTTPPFTRSLPGVSHVWVDIWMKFSSNFTVVAPTSWGCTSGRSYKLIHGTVWGPDAGRFGLEIDPGQWWWVTPDDPYLVAANSGLPSAVLANGPLIDGVRRPPEYFFDDKWHRYRYELKLSSATGVRDGLAKVWIDNVLWIDLGPQVVNRSAIWGIKLGANLNQGPARLQNIWYGRIRLLTTDPGW